MIKRVTVTDQLDSASSVETQTYIFPEIVEEKELSIKTFRGDYNPINHKADEEHKQQRNFTNNSNFVQEIEQGTVGFSFSKKKKTKSKRDFDSKSTTSRTEQIENKNFIILKTTTKDVDHEPSLIQRRNEEDDETKRASLSTLLLSISPLSISRNRREARETD